MHLSSIRREKIHVSEDQKIKDQKKEDALAQNVRDLAKCCVLPNIRAAVTPDGRLAKAAGAETLSQKPRQNVHSTCSAKRICKSKSKKSHKRRSTFGRPAVENLYLALVLGRFSLL